jgi:hypothetical protein
MAIHNIKTGHFIIVDGMVIRPNRRVALEILTTKEIIYSQIIKKVLTLRGWESIDHSTYRKEQIVPWYTALKQENILLLKRDIVRCIVTEKNRLKNLASQS